MRNLTSEIGHEFIYIRSMSETNAHTEAQTGDDSARRPESTFAQVEPIKIPDNGLNLVELSQSQWRASPFLQGGGNQGDGKSGGQSDRQSDRQSGGQSDRQATDPNVHMRRVAQEIQTRYNETRTRFNQEVNSQGALLGRPVSAIKDMLGTEHSAYSINRRFDQERLKVDRLQELANQGNAEEFRQLYRSLTGFELEPPNNQKVTRRLSIESLIGDYDQSQRSWVNTAALTVPFMMTGFRGAPWVMNSQLSALQGYAALGRSIPLSMAHDGLIVAGGNVAMKMADGRYSNPGYDAATGFVTGALWAPAQRASSWLTEGYIARNGTSLGITPMYQGPLTTTFNVNGRGAGMYMTESFLRHGSSWSLYGAYEPLFREGTDLTFGRYDSFDAGRVARNSLYGMSTGLFAGQLYGMTYTPFYNRVVSPLWSRFQR